jgi:hypothetical protein
LDNAKISQLAYKSKLMADQLVRLHAGLASVVDEFRLGGDGSDDNFSLLACHTQLFADIVSWCRYPAGEPPQTPHHHQCPVGEWLYSTGVLARFRSDPSYQALTEAHKKFHETARSLIEEDLPSGVREQKLSVLADLYQSVDEGLVRLYLSSLDASLD